MKSPRLVPCSFSEHSADLLLVHVLVEAAVQALPPLEEHRVADELEPRGELQRRVVKELLELLGRDVLCGLNLVGAGVKVDIRLDKEDVVNCEAALAKCIHSGLLQSRTRRSHTCSSILTFMLAPFAVARSLVVDPGKEVELLDRHLLLLDTKLVIKLALRGALDALNSIGEGRTSLARNTEGMRAASVGPHVWEGDLLCGALLEEELVLVVEEEDGEGAVKETLVDVRHEMAYGVALAFVLCFMTNPGLLDGDLRFWEQASLSDPNMRRTDLLAGGANGHVIVISDDANLVHKANLLGIVASERIATGVDIGEQTKHVLGRDYRLSLGDGRCGRHDGWSRCDALLLQRGRGKRSVDCRKEVKTMKVGKGTVKGLLSLV